MLQVVVVRARSFVKMKTEAADSVAHVASLAWAPCCPIDEHQLVQTCDVAEEEPTLDIVVVVVAAAEFGKREAHHYHNALGFGGSQCPVVVLVGISPNLVLRVEAWEHHQDVVVLPTDE